MEIYIIDKSIKFVLFVICFFILECQCEENVINLKILQANPNNTKNDKIPFTVPYEYNSCSVFHCGDELCAYGPNAVCQADNKTLIEKCVCNEGYITYKENEAWLCCYEQKSSFTALLLEVIIGFGLGHFYTGNISLGLLKAAIYLLLCCSSGVILLQMYKSSYDIENKSFLFKVACTICSLLCSCTYICWQIVDAILFSIGSYTDANGAQLESV